MVLVDHDRVGVGRARRVGAHPFVEMFMIRLHPLVGMQEIQRIMSGPDDERQERAEAAQHRQDDEGRLRVGVGGNQSGDRIGDQPAGVRQGELGGEQGRSLDRRR